MESDFKKKPGSAAVSAPVSMTRKTKRVHVANSLGISGRVPRFSLRAVSAFRGSDSWANKRVALCYFPDQTDSALADSSTFLF